MEANQNEAANGNGMNILIEEGLIEGDIMPKAEKKFHCNNVGLSMLLEKLQSEAQKVISAKEVEDLPQAAADQYMLIIDKLSQLTIDLSEMKVSGPLAPILGTILTIYIRAPWKLDDMLAQYMKIILEETMGAKK